MITPFEAEALLDILEDAMVTEDLREYGVSTDGLNNINESLEAIARGE